MVPLSSQTHAQPETPAHKYSLVSIVVRDPGRDREARLRPIVRRALPELPPVHEQQRAVRRQPLLHVELEAHRGVDSAGDVEREGRDEEPGSRLAAGQAIGERAGCPIGEGEGGEVPSLPLAVEAAFVEDAADSVGEAAMNKGY